MGPQRIYLLQDDVLYNFPPLSLNSLKCTQKTFHVPVEHSKFAGLGSGATLNGRNFPAQGSRIRRIGPWYARQPRPLLPIPAAGWSHCRGPGPAPATGPRPGGKSPPKKGPTRPSLYLLPLRTVGPPHRSRFSGLGADMFVTGATSGCLQRRFEPLPRKKRRGYPNFHG